MRTATFHFSESGGSQSGQDLFTELPFLWKSLVRLSNPSFIECLPPFHLKTLLFPLKSASSHPLPKTGSLTYERPRSSRCLWIIVGNVSVWTIVLQLEGFGSELRSCNLTQVYVYEPFLPTHGTDIKVYTVGKEYIHAEARKAPTIDGKVQRSTDGKEIRCLGLEKD